MIFALPLRSARTLFPCFVSLALLSAAAAHAQTATPSSEARAGIAKLVKGQVSVLHSGDERPLRPGDPVAATDRIATGTDGSASVVLRDGTLLVVGSDSRIELREFAFDPTTYQGNMLVAVVRGSMRMVSGLIRKARADAVGVVTPTALVGIRGTDFIVDVEPTEEAK